MFDRRLSKRVGRAFVCAIGIATVAILCAGTASAQTSSKKTVVALKQAPLKAVTPSGQDVALADVVAAPPPTLVAGLPKTASNVPFIFVMGLFFMTAAVALNTTLCRRA